MRAFFTLLFALSAVAGAATAAQTAAAKKTVAKTTISLRTDVVVRGGLVRIGDIFRNTGAKSTISIAYAPAPGRQAVLDASWLSETAERHGLDWRPNSHLDQVQVRRASIPLARAEVAREVSQMVRRRGLKGEFQVALGYRIQNLHLPVDSGGNFTIRDLRLDERSGRFSAVLTAPVVNPSLRLNIYGRVQKLVAVPVLARGLRKGAVIRDADVVMRKIARAGLPQYALLERTSIIGMAARFRLRPGITLRKQDVRPPLLVRRGDLVTMEIRTPYILITARGRAIDSGARGDTIRLRNIKSKKLLEARVVGPGLVSFSLPIAKQRAAR